MDRDRLISLRDEYQAKKDTYTPEQQEAMEAKFGSLVQKVMEEDKQQQAPVTQPQPQPQPKQKADVQSEPKQYRVTL